MKTFDEDEQPMGPVGFMDRAALVLWVVIAAVAVYFGTVVVLSLGVS